MARPLRLSHLVLAFAAMASGAGAGCLTGSQTQRAEAGAPAFIGSAGGTSAAGGALGGASGGAVVAGAAPAGSGGDLANGGQSVAGSGPLPGTGGTSSGGTNASGTGGVASSGAGGVASGGTGGRPFVDPPGTMFCDSTSLNLGEMHLLTNEWTDPLAETCVFLDLAGSFGWRWTRGATGMGEHPGYPNYPELEFGINPWNTKGLDQSTTTLLPLQLKDIATASMTVDVFTDVGSNNTGWNLAFELWLADKNPALGPASPKGELMVFLSNAPGYYPTDPETAQTLNDGNRDYKLYVSSDNWGTWGYYRQYRLDTHDGKFNGKLDIGKFLKHYVEAEHGDGNLWVTRFELGNEVYQNSGGTTTMKSVSFEVNGQVRAAQTR